MKKVQEGPLLCPICMELPEDKIFQCMDGHTLCQKCSASIKICPQCRVPFGERKIRNRALEDLIGGMEISCTYKSYGCNADILKRELPGHIEACKFRPIGVCKMIAYPDCNFESIKPTEIFRHLVNYHKKKLCADFSGLADFKEQLNYMKTAQQGSQCYTRVVDCSFTSSEPLRFLECFYIDMDKQEYIFHLFHFLSTEKCPFQVELKFVVPRKNFGWTWTGVPIYYKRMEYALRNPAFKIPMQYLLDQMDDAHLKFQIVLVSKQL